ncbi:hypothetical protein COX93_03140 [Candidatus Nomurabacteria bacterium CG_4_10_14_0_2_um_filter_30_12]|uniref:Uncharacterized protein n=2 Tax=Candidatus Nomuraibacteriota TaxID=1752729 RepID=A0A2J0MF16_9BACT|nr:MAG: hypothetical protein COU48_01120 [Candidatus Nomurabacteria bacterium CG10_big_fil_rev_8_21_14_0_10_03_31_7]PIZ86802.1 MAG: hypothetical protein COX93_03140 [Candidatus Nomurabacteria bacterium CG_4_10_14_0_2_um_filter_30_12]
MTYKIKSLYLRRKKERSVLMYNLYFFVNFLSEEIKTFSFNSDEQVLEEVRGKSGELYKEISEEEILKEDFLFSKKVCYFFISGFVLNRTNFFKNRINTKKEIKRKERGHYFVKVER